HHSHGDLGVLARVGGNCDAVKDDLAVVLVLKGEHVNRNAVRVGSGDLFVHVTIVLIAVGDQDNTPAEALREGGYRQSHSRGQVRSVGVLRKAELLDVKAAPAGDDVDVRFAVKTDDADAVVAVSVLGGVLDEFLSGRLLLFRNAV